MLRFYSVVMLSCLLYGLAVSVETKTKEKVYYKQTVATAAAGGENVPKEEVPIVVEGQPPSSESIKLNSAKINSLKEVVKKESKTVPRKGVIDKSSEKDDQNTTVILDPEVAKTLVKDTKLSTVSLQPQKEVPVNSSKISTSTIKTTTLHIAPVREEQPKPEIMVDAVTAKTTRKPKPKPIVTTGGKEADEPIPASPTNNSPLGMPRKIDYIVPIIITVTALPLLGVAFYVLYKRGRDYWDKRHYRRMDFLIDGMYNE